MEIRLRKNLIHEPSLGLDCVTPSRTVQSFRDECDVNIILRNYVKTGVLTHTTNQKPVFGDFSQLPADYGEAVALIRKSEEMFNALPSNIRDRFDNSPANLVKFLQDENNRSEAEMLGIVIKHVDNVDEVE